MSRGAELYLGMLLKLVELGGTQRALAKMFGRSQSSIHRDIRLAREAESLGLLIHNESAAAKSPMNPGGLDLLLIHMNQPRLGLPEPNEVRPGRVTTPCRGAGSTFCLTA